MAISLPLSAISTISCGQLVGALLGLVAIRQIVLVVYRLWFHPLAHIPGPLTARGSYLWGFYWDVVQGGRSLQQFPALHRKYGKVVRVAPNEVHIDDNEAYQQVYKLNAPFYKDAAFYGTAGAPTSSLLMIDPAQSRMRRDILGPLFSKRTVNSLEGMIYEKIEILCAKIGELANEGKVVPLQNAFYGMTLDLIAKYAFGTAFNVLDAPAFESEIVKDATAISDGLWVGYHFPFLRTIAMASPRWLAALMAKHAISFMTKCESLVRGQIEAKSKGERPSHTTIFDVLLDPAATKNRVPAFQELADEALVVLFAGTDTTANALAYAVWYFLTQPAARGALQAELAAAAAATSDGRFALSTLEALPYLTAFIKETLRCSYGVPGKQPRVVPPGGLAVGPAAQFLPAGSVVSFSTWMVHRDPALWDDPWAFKPERWLAPGAKELDRWLVSFGKGSRQCIGINLAYAELYLTLANLFTRFDMSLWGTTDLDMGWNDQGVTHTNGTLKVMAKARSQEVVA